MLTICAPTVPTFPRNVLVRINISTGSSILREDIIVRVLTLRTVASRSDTYVCGPRKLRSLPLQGGSPAEVFVFAIVLVNLGALSLRAGKSKIRIVMHSHPSLSGFAFIDGVWGVWLSFSRGPPAAAASNACILKTYKIEFTVYQVHRHVTNLPVGKRPDDIKIFFSFEV